MDLTELTTRQRVSLWLDGREGLHTPGEAAQFLDEVALALRYNATPDLPLASLYRATQRQVPVPEEEKTAHARAFDLSNSLLASGEAIETNVVANRLTLASPRLMPMIYALRRGQVDEPPLSEVARQALEFIRGNEGATSGDVRRMLNVSGQTRPDPADLALGELQRELLIDRGPSSAPSSGGIFYLSREGYPYRILAEAHPEIVSAAARIDRSDAAVQLLEMYLNAAVFAPIRKLQTLFQLLLTREELEKAVAALVDGSTLERVRAGRAEVAVITRAQS